MRYLALPSASYEEIRAGQRAYREFLEAKREQFPSETFSFASAEWHYDAHDHRSLHDSWVKAIEVNEVEVAKKARGTRIVLQLIAPYHDGDTTLRYDGVHKYEVSTWRETGAVQAGHGDLLIDEVALDEQGHVVHEILFTSGTLWRVTCASLSHATTAPANTIEVIME